MRQRIVAAAGRAVAHYSDVNTALRDGYKPFHPSGKMGEEVHYTNRRNNRLEQRHMTTITRDRSCTNARRKACRRWESCTSAPQDSTRNS